MKRTVVVAYAVGPVEGEVEVLYGTLAGLKVVEGKGSTDGARFAVRSEGPCRLAVTVQAPAIGPGPESPLVTLRTKEDPFSFFLRDVSRECPIVIPRYGVAVTEVRDRRSYAEMEADIRARGLATKMQQMEAELEETYADAAEHTRSLTCPTWLGLSRDVRIFELGFEGGGEPWAYVMPRFHGVRVTAPDLPDQPVRFNLFIGRGVGATHDITRRLEDGALPILHARIDRRGRRLRLHRLRHTGEEQADGPPPARHALPGGGRLRPRPHVHARAAGGPRRAEAGRDGRGPRRRCSGTA